MKRVFLLTPIIVLAFTGCAAAGPNLSPIINFLLNSQDPNNESSSFKTVVSSTGRVWMDRNLGASRVATSSTDSEAYGDLYQWGRGTDGHEKRNSSKVSMWSTSDTPGHGKFLFVSGSDWRMPQNDNLWQGVSGVNNPCPAGFRLPTEAELEAERASWGSSDAAGAFASPLKLVAAGYRFSFNGIISNAGSMGHYWSGTVTGHTSRSLNLTRDDANVYSSYNRANGFSVRCIKD